MVFSNVMMMLVIFYSMGQVQSALQDSGHLESSPQSYQQLQSGTSSVVLQVRLVASKTCPLVQPNLLGSLPKKQVKKNWQSVG